jgi:hypothetical protein
MFLVNGFPQMSFLLITYRLYIYFYVLQVSGFSEVPQANSYFTFVLANLIASWTRCTR